MFEELEPEEEKHLPPKPYLDLSGQPIDEKLSSINRVTYRLSFIRERGGEEYQVFPSEMWMGMEIPISHRQPAFGMPDLSVELKPHKLDLAWIKTPRLVCLLNKTCWKGVTKPTEQQVQTIKESVIQIGFSKSEFPLKICPGETQPMLLSPSALNIYVKAEAHHPSLSIFAV